MNSEGAIEGAVQQEGKDKDWTFETCLDFYTISLDEWRLERNPYEIFSDPMDGGDGVQHGMVVVLDRQRLYFYHDDDRGSTGTLKLLERLRVTWDRARPAFKAAWRAVRNLPTAVRADELAKWLEPEGPIAKAHEWINPHVSLHSDGSLTNLHFLVLVDSQRKEKIVASIPFDETVTANSLAEAILAHRSEADEDEPES